MPIENMLPNYVDVYASTDLGTSVQNGIKITRFVKLGARRSRLFFLQLNGSV